MVVRNERLWMFVYTGVTPRNVLQRCLISKTFAAFSCPPVLAWKTKSCRSSH